MPSLPDTAVIIFLGLLLFGPKGLAQIARQLGKLMGEFRRASNEFRMQMEEELRISEQADRQKEIAAIEAAAPVPPALASTQYGEIGNDIGHDIGEVHPHLPSAALETAEATPEPLAIATSGELSIMPPATGLPAPRSSSPGPSSLSSLIDSVPKMEPNLHAEGFSSGENNGDANGMHESKVPGDEERPMRYTHHDTGRAGQQVATEETLHG